MPAGRRENQEDTEMSVSYAERYRGELPSFKEMTEKFYKKEVSVKDYKGFSGFFGSYAQRGGEASMLRLRMNAGQITKEKLKFIADSQSGTSWAPAYRALSNRKANIFFLIFSH